LEDGLGLYKVGDARLGYSWDRALQGQIKKAQNADYIQVVQLNVDEHVFNRTRAGSGMIKLRDSYEDIHGPGEILVFDGGEYIQADRNPDRRLSITWSTSMDPTEFIDRAISLFGPPTADGKGLIILQGADSDEEIGEGAAKDVYECAIAYSDRIKYVTIDLNESTLMWAAKASRLTSSDISYAEAGVACSESLASRIHHIVSETATDRLSATTRRGPLLMELGKAGTVLQL
jgi:hypothetical protein